MLIREKAAPDARSCADLLRRVHAVDSYPVPFPEDVTAWLTPAREIASWVADDDGAVIGHVAVHRAEDRPLVAAAEHFTGLRADGMAVLSRLFTAPEERRKGVGRALLRHATCEARRRGLRLVLDVGRNQSAPVALYESEGWHRVEALDVPVGGIVLVLWAYVSPEESP